MWRWVAVPLLCFTAGCLARVERAVIAVNEPSTALEKSAAALRREGFLVPTLDARRGVVRTAWKFTQRRDGDGWLYYRYVVEQADPHAPSIAMRIEVLRCQYAPVDGEAWERSRCDRMPPRVPLWAEEDYRRVADVLRRVLRWRAQ